MLRTDCSHSITVHNSFRIIISMILTLFNDIGIGLIFGVIGRFQQFWVSFCKSQRDLFIESITSKLSKAPEH